MHEEATGHLQIQERGPRHTCRLKLPLLKCSPKIGAPLQKIGEVDCQHVLITDIEIITF